jgi:hypothetical protein
MSFLFDVINGRKAKVLLRLFLLRLSSVGCHSTCKKKPEVEVLSTAVARYSDERKNFFCISRNCLSKEELHFNFTGDDFLSSKNPK